jgi:hypothetical protein
LPLNFLFIFLFKVSFFLFKFSGCFSYTLFNLVIKYKISCYFNLPDKRERFTGSDGGSKIPSAWFVFVKIIGPTYF